MCLTAEREHGTLCVMALKLQLLDPDRRRRRLQLLARLADAKSTRDTASPRPRQADRLREIIALRRRLAG